MSKPLDLHVKAPKQGRSKALVDAIFEATVRILPKVGSQNVTTKKIAELAGVSIGSLYQYFPNKEAVLSAVMDLSMSSSQAVMEKKIDEMKGSSIDDFVEAMVDHGLKTFLTEREKIRELYRQAPELGKIPSLFKMRQKIIEMLAEEMRKQSPGREWDEYVRMSFIAGNSVMGVVHTMLYDERQNYSIDELAVELKTMLRGYFRDRGLMPRIESQ